MRARERIVRERFADHKCAHCGATYPSEGVVILARRSSTWMVMVSCSNCLRPGLFLVSFPSQTSSRFAVAGEPSSALSAEASIDVAPISPAALLAEQSSETPAYAPQPDSLAPVTDADVNAMHEFLANFNGNFSKLFPKPR
ncbi:MAG: hypothetical protein ACLQUY_19380 [Ktedonobacterales bacterium]